MKFALKLFICSLLLLQKTSAALYIGDKSLRNVTSQDGTFIGSTKLKDSSFHSLSVVGPFSFQNLKIQKKAEIVGETINSQNGEFEVINVTGPFFATDVKCDEFNVVGFVQVSRLYVLKYARIVGYLSAYESSFNDMEITSNEIRLEDTELNNLIVKKNEYDKQKKEVVYLKGHTVVRGDIIFESGKGIVKQDPASKVNGRIIGAILEGA